MTPYTLMTVAFVLCAVSFWIAVAYGDNPRKPHLATIAMCMWLLSVIVFAASAVTHRHTTKTKPQDCLPVIAGLSLTGFTFFDDGTEYSVKIEAVKK